MRKHVFTTDGIKRNTKTWRGFDSCNQRNSQYPSLIKKFLSVTVLLLSMLMTNAQTNLEAITYGSGKFVAIASNGELLSSSDGITWTSVAAPSGNWQDIIYENNLYVVVGSNSAMTSPDGETWTVQTVPSGGWVAVVSNGSLFIASSTGGNYVMTSPDGITWTARTPAYPWPHNDLAYGSISGVDRFVAVCQLGRGWIASDPTGTWSQINPGAIVDIRAITFGNGKFVWLQWGGSGTVYAGVSTNGTNFTPYATGVVNQWNSLVYGNNTYVAVASGGSNMRAAYSANGQTWTYGTGVEANSWQSVAFGNSTFVAVANTGTNRIMYSTDGIQWNHDVVLPPVIVAPTITSFSPINTISGEQVVITGTDLENSTEIQIGGLTADSFTIDSPTQITAVVPVNAVSGSISVTNGTGSGSLSGFVINSSPADIALSADLILENNILNQVIGSLSTTDIDVMDTHSYRLVTGVGDTNNTDFTITGTDLLANAVFDFETNSDYSIRVETQDNFGQAFEKTLVITVTNANERPTDITLSNSTILENSAIGTVIGSLSTIDQDAGDTYTYSLVVGDGSNDADNASVNINGTDLKIALIPDYETQSSYKIYLNVNDGANEYQKAFVVTVGDINEDLDGDGISDDLDQCPDTASGETVDSNGCAPSQYDADSDGVPDYEDAFPNDPIESVDTDGDGIGDTMDTDDDNDGYSDELELAEGTDSKDANAFPLDSDGDGIPDSIDPDDDNDGTLDSEDFFPTNASPGLIAAEAFTPNGDGVNDYWVIPGIESYPNSVVTVYNRSGHEVFMAKGYRNDWNAAYKSNASKLPPGSYLYIIDLGNGSQPIKGWIFINY